MNLDANFKRFVEERRYLLNVSFKTREWYESSWKVFGPHLATATAPEEIKTLANDAIIAAKKSRKLAPVSVNNYIRCINAFLNWMVKAELLEKPIKLDKLKELKKVRKLLTDEQVRMLVKFKPNRINERRAHILALTALDTGMRLSEIRRLRREFIDLDNNLITIHSGKGKKQRRIPFTDELRKHLYSYMTKHATVKDGYIFGTKGRNILTQRNAQRDFAALCKRAKIGTATFHSLRHTFATNYLKRGGNIAYLRRILGHSTLAVTQIYEHLQTEDLKFDHDRFSSLYDQVKL